MHHAESTASAWSRCWDQLQVGELSNTEAEEFLKKKWNIAEDDKESAAKAKEVVGEMLCT